MAPNLNDWIRQTGGTPEPGPDPEPPRTLPGSSAGQRPGIPTPPPNELRSWIRHGDHGSTFDPHETY